MADIPHFAVPFRITGTSATVVEQDSDEDILACAETILRTPVGSRIEEPEFGMEDPTFTTDPAVIERVAIDALHEWEPRTTALAEAEIDDLIAKATVNLG